MLMPMKRQLDLAGKGLAGTGLTGIVGYVIATAPLHSSPVWPYWLFGGMVVTGAAAYLVGQGQPEPQAAETVEAPEPEPAETLPAPLCTGRWRHTLSGHEVPSLMMITHKGFSHPGYMRPSSEDRPPFVRFGVLVACDPLGPSPTTSALRDRFLSFLASPPVADLVNAVSYVSDDLSWMNYGSNGRFYNEAVLVRGADQAEAPVASVMLNLHEPGLAQYGHDSRTAELVFHIEPRDKDGGVAPAAEFKAWYEALILALDLPRAFARFLEQDVELATHGEPPAQLGLELRGRRDIAELVDASGLPQVAGSWRSNSFLGYMVAEHDGNRPGAASVEMLRSICDHALHLHGYEDALDRLNSKSSD